MPSNRNYSQFLTSFHSDKFQGLREAQDFILQQYNSHYVEVPDVGIELPTGAGKTLIALLVAEAWRQEGRKVAILSANKTLARQMQNEADALGIPAILMEGSGPEIPAADRRAYHRSARVAIMNYWVYFNQNPVIDPADLLVMDDAHLAEHCLHSLYSVEITKHKHNDLFRELVSELQARFSEYTVLTDALAGDVPPTSVTELLSFIDQVDVLARFREIVDSSRYLREDIDLSFRWHRIRNNLGEANLYISLNSIWIRPYIYPLISNEYYNQPEQRLYMSATVGDPGDLSRRLGVNRITKIPIPPAFAERTQGRRLIVMNRIEDADIPSRLGDVIIAALRIQPKSVWLCSSESEAHKFQNAVSQWLNLSGLVGHPTWFLSPLGNEIEHFKASPTGHLFVAGRFDGMDFQEEQCRLVVITTLPRAINSQEEFISAYLRDSGFMLRRLNQRVVQALGRCNRSEDDFGVYVLADRRFATHFGRESNKEGLPRNIIAEIDMAQDMAEVGVDVLVRKVENFLQGDFREYDNEIQAYIDNVPLGNAHAQGPDTSEHEITGWAALFASHNYEIAADRFERCWDIAKEANLLEIGALYGWQLAKALYLQSMQGEAGTRERSLDILERSIRRGGQSSWFNRMRSSLNRARQVPPAEQIIRDEYASQLVQVFDDILERQNIDGARFTKWCAGVTEALGSERHAQFQEGLAKLGQILGYSASRPQYNAATDCRWRGVFGNSREIITFEAKIEQRDGGEISAYHMGQAHNQLERAIREFDDNGYTVRGTIVTHLATMTPDAQAAIGNIKVLTKPAVLALWDRIRLVLSLYRDTWSLHDIQARRVSAQLIRPRLPSTGWLIRALDFDGSFVDSERLLSEWPLP